ncbi:glycosyltransferase family 4 protein [Robiginitalea biformata]|uniref:glycosyltransferase family 4 protein n=2 Tax=Robiginitalea biformata TaxID=252307 RepID=UPI000320C10C|nr:glycosyltransferase family 4 protein [Robiginitalea biformata]
MRQLSGKRKIAFVIHNLGSGGAERVVTLLANHLVQSYHVTIITHKKRQPFYELHKEICVIHCFNDTLRSQNALESIRNNWRLYKRVNTLIRENRIELCIGFMTTSNVLSVLASRSNGIPVVISERNNPEEEKNKLSHLWRFLKKYTYRKADKLVVQNNRIKSLYINDIDNKKLQIIPNPINPGLRPDPNVEMSNIILNVGRLERQKAQDTLIKAFANLNPSGWELHIIGDGRQRSYLEALIDQLHMNDKVRLLGKKKNIQPYYAKARIFVLSSLYEGFPNVLLEAMQMGKACISTDCPTGPSDIISHGDDGILVPVGNTAELEAALRDLIENPAKERQLGEKAKDATRPYQIENIAAVWEELIAELLK